MDPVVGILLVLLSVTKVTDSLDNGVALTPPMGWSSSERYRCNVDCRSDPNNCISENLLINMAEKLVADGFKNLGYVYVNIGDCWSEKRRDANCTLVADRDRFPHGIKWLADYMHSKGLKLGIYADIGLYTCNGYPGSKFYLEKDAHTFAAWGVDSIKLDAFNSNVEDMEYGYPAMSRFLNETGRPILFSCSWPAYVMQSGKIPDYKNVARYCNTWRNYHDVQDSWDSVLDIIQFYGNDTGGFSLVAGPGQYNDPDTLVVGDFGLSYDQQRVQVALWAILSAPLMMSADLLHLKPDSKRLLQNYLLTRINQDSAGIQGRRIVKEGKFEVWTKAMGRERKALAFVFLNLNENGGPIEVSMHLYEMGLTDERGYNVTNIFDYSLRTMKPQDLIVAEVNPTGIWMGYADCYYCY